MKCGVRYELSVTQVRQESPVSEVEAGLGTGHTASKQLELDGAGLTFTSVTRGLNWKAMRDIEILQIVCLRV